MDFSESEDTVALRNLVRRFLDREVPAELAAKWDREDRIPREMLGRLADLGLCALTVPEEYGGLGHGVAGMVTAVRELGARSTALAMLFIQNAGYGSLNMIESGSDAQKREFLPALAEGKLLFAYGLSEPDAGADLASVKTRAERRADTVVINGTKRWCTGAATADFIYMLVRSGDPEARRDNLSLLLVPSDAPGMTMQSVEIMGVRGLPTNDVFLENVEIPIEAVLGGEAGWNKGWSQLAGPTLEAEKLSVAALALSLAEAAVAEAWQYAQDRVQFGKPICTLQSVRHTLVEAQTKLAACTHMLDHAVWKVDAGEPSAVETSMTKLFVSETARDIVLACQQVLGAYGYAEGFAMERYVRDVLIMPIWGGSSAIQKNNIANLMRLPR